MVPRIRNDKRGNKTKYVLLKLSSSFMRGKNNLPSIGESYSDPSEEMCQKKTHIVSTIPLRSMLLENRFPSTDTEHLEHLQASPMNK